MACRELPVDVDGGGSVGGRHRRDPCDRAVGEGKCRRSALLGCVQIVSTDVCGRRSGGPKPRSNEAGVALLVRATVKVGPAIWADEVVAQSVAWIR